jgi:hypothetical protein
MSRFAENGAASALPATAQLEPAKLAIEWQAASSEA